MYEDRRANRNEIVLSMQMDPRTLADIVDVLAEEAIMPLGFLVEFDRDGPRARLWVADPDGAMEALDAAGFEVEAVGGASVRDRRPAAQGGRSSLGRSR